MDVGAPTPPLWGFEEREKLMVFYERASGSRMHAAYFRLGGVHQDLPRHLIDDIWNLCDPFLRCATTSKRCHRQPHLQAAQRRHRRMSLEDACKRGFSGVMVRGSGAAWDLRKSQPYECYTESISTFRSARTATITTASASASRRCASWCAS